MHEYSRGRKCRVSTVGTFGALFTTVQLWASTCCFQRRIPLYCTIVHDAVHIAATLSNVSLGIPSNIASSSRHAILLRNTVAFTPLPRSRTRWPYRAAGHSFQSTFFLSSSGCDTSPLRLVLVRPTALVLPRCPAFSRTPYTRTFPPPKPTRTDFVQESGNSVPRERGRGRPYFTSARGILLLLNKKRRNMRWKVGAQFRLIRPY